LASGKAQYYLTILSDKKLHNIKRSVEIRLDRRITQKQLEVLAYDIKGLDSNHYDRTFILYFLPYQKPGAGAWASTHFNPKLKVEILGATVEDVKKFREFSIVNGWQVPEPPKPPAKTPLIWSEIPQTPVNLKYGGEILGEWIWDVGDLSHKITVFKKDGTIMMNKYYRDGSQGTVKLKATKVRRGLRLDELQPNSFGEYFIINKSGQLEFYDMEHDLKHGTLLVLTPERNNKASH
jgi:hypothetical protein